MTKVPTSQVDVNGNTESAECVICQDTEDGNSVVLNCNHKFHEACINRALAVKPVCPCCNTCVGKPQGVVLEGATMMHMIEKTSLPGYEGCNTICIVYNIPDGTQGAQHPHPGKTYHGTNRVAYLPDNEDGRHVLGLLSQAFVAGLVFVVGRSLTTGLDDSIVWNDIHHKTHHTGAHGYPDAGYLQRVKEDLRAKGIE
uniref:E3 ubiquitin-protein ligase DTX3L-like n=1 Tax=Ciona intestinalis TaxID=7719 RepID=UPI00089DCF9A|nr:E3 ubiquitin-protein ligase DTX3L-like [Ciona intestinalis]|eukprot:XP_018671733.1 E3 ubiquitin-protein ligase DTX3L-like [Ciona intestinalis]